MCKGVYSDISGVKYNIKIYIHRQIISGTMSREKASMPSINRSRPLTNVIIPLFAVRLVEPIQGVG